MDEKWAMDLDQEVKTKAMALLAQSHCDVFNYDPRQMIYSTYYFHHRQTKY